MATPVTPRSSKDFSSLGIISAAVLGITDSRFNGNTNIQFIPNMDGFPNGRRLEDDVTTIELQAVGGAALAAVGLFYDDYTDTTMSPLTTQLLKTLSFTAGPTHNDTAFQTAFPYVQMPWRGFTGPEVPGITVGLPQAMNFSAPAAIMKNYPNPFSSNTTFSLHTTTAGPVIVRVYDMQGKMVATIVNEYKQAGDYTITWSANGLQNGTYFAALTADNEPQQVVKMICEK